MVEPNRYRRMPADSIRKRRGKCQFSGGEEMKVYPFKTGALCANSHPGSYTGQDAFNDMLPVIRRTNELSVCREWSASSDVHDAGNEHAGLHARPAICSGGGTELEQDRKYVLRRLTPLECCRLQGFPDWWTDGVEGSDSAVYKMWGNGIALPCAADVLGRIAKEIERCTAMKTKTTNP